MPLRTFHEFLIDLHLIATLDNLVMGLERRLNETCDRINTLVSAESF